ncbi:MAG: leucyl aminopeptidase, partial [Gammaproteobacteria bacterium]
MVQDIMEFSIKSGIPERQRAGCLIVGVFESRKLSAAAKAVDSAGKRYLSNLIKRGDISGKPGQALLLHSVPGVTAQRVLLIGCGRERDMDDAEYRKIIVHSLKQAATTGAADAINCLPELAVKGRDTAWKIYQAALFMQQDDYQFREFKSKKRGPAKSLRKMILMAPADEATAAGAALRQAKATAKGVKLARDLANRPANACTPEHLAEQARALAKTRKAEKALRVTVLDEPAMHKLGMHSLLSVSRGSAEPARLIIFEYKGGAKKDKPVVLVGKGVTFDTGGISIKPSAAMDEMKFDMCGAASVFGTVCAVMEMGLPVNLVGVVPATENMPGSKATKPGDIFTSMSGQT